VPLAPTVNKDRQDLKETEVLLVLLAASDFRDGRESSDQLVQPGYQVLKELVCRDQLERLVLLDCQVFQVQWVQQDKLDQEA
jgi:hypothetical protein